jgi:hypothetical protein
LFAVKIYGISIGGGAALIGIVGGLLGGGAGALAGGAVGAELGADAGTAILYLMGLKFLAEFVLSHRDEANKHFREARRIAWDACGNSGTIDLAAQEYGRGFADLVSLILEATAALVITKGLKAGLEELNKTEAGRALAPYAKIQYWREKLGVTDALIPRRGIGTTIAFFEEQVAKGRLDPTEFADEAKLKEYWQGMDFSKEIKVETLRPGKELVAYRDPASPFGYYYAEVGTYLDKLGVDSLTKQKLPKGHAGPAPLVPRQFLRYRVVRQVEVLRSASSGVKSYDVGGGSPAVADFVAKSTSEAVKGYSTGKSVPGGATQYFIPRAWEVLELVPAPPKAMSPIPTLKKTE